MRTKAISIQIRSLDAVLDEFVEVANKTKSGKNVKPRKGTYVADAETARAIFTDARLRIIQVLKSKSPQSIYALAKALNRDFKNVYDDIVFLEQLGILKVEESTSGRKQKKPILVCDKILFDMVA
jgi:predicted transcriptional regulator